MRLTNKLRSLQRTVVLLSLVNVPLWAAAKEAVLPAGSIDGLADAIAAAGPRGTVIVETGHHQESASIAVEFPVRIVGEKDSVIEITTVPNDFYDPFSADAALHIRKTNDVTVEGVSFRAPILGNVAILIEASINVKIRDNVFSEHIYGVIIESGKNIEVSGNTFDGLLGIGMIHLNGQRTRVLRNHFRGCDIGFWISGESGICALNSSSGNNFGFFFCLFPGAEVSATAWQVIDNEAHENAFFGYLVTDGSSYNLLANNAGSGNGFADELPPFLQGTDVLLDGGGAPSVGNQVVLGSHQDLMVIDLGLDNEINPD